jgi:transcriptional regulator with XRE-family HTH domain
MPDLARILKRTRVLRGMKQSHLAELLSVTQATVCRWERGTHRPSEAQMPAVMAFIATPSASVRDAALKRLVESSARRVHLICDATHRLLAASPAREADWGVPACTLLGRSLWPFASPEIQAAEARLEALGWYEEATPAVAFHTDAIANPVVPIVPGIVLWERMRLDDGSGARLVSTLAVEQLPSDVVRV